MTILPYNGKEPVLGERVFVADGAFIIGDVVLEEDASVWFNTVVRGDIHHIRIGARSNLQDGVVVHVEHGAFPTIIEHDVSIGHNAVIHGCTIRRGCLIGMGAVILNGAEIGERSIVAAGAVVREGATIPPHSLVTGVPAVVKRELTPPELERATASAVHYLQYKSRFLAEAADLDDAG